MQGSFLKKYLIFVSIGIMICFALKTAGGFYLELKAMEFAKENSEVLRQYDSGNTDELRLILQTFEKFISKMDND